MPYPNTITPFLMNQGTWPAPTTGTWNGPSQTGSWDPSMTTGTVAPPTTGSWDPYGGIGMPIDPTQYPVDPYGAPSGPAFGFGPNGPVQVGGPTDPSSPAFGFGPNGPVQVGGPTDPYMGGKPYPGRDGGYTGPQAATDPQMQEWYRRRRQLMNTGG